MKRFFAAVFTALILLFSMASCELFPNNRYALRVEGDKDIFLEQIQKGYEAGETVTLKRNEIYDVDVEVYLNGELLQEKEVRTDNEHYYEYSFTMPNLDSVLEVKLVGGFFPDVEDDDHTMLFEVKYDYGITTGRATMLLGYSNVFFDPEAYGIAPLLAGDTVAVKYTGELYIRESYPGTVVIEDGEIISVQKAETQIFRLEYLGTGFLLIRNGKTKLLSGNFPEQVVYADGSFKSLSEIPVGTTLYATGEEYYSYVNKDIRFSIAALYADYPLPIEEAKNLYPWIASLEKAEIKKVQTEENGLLYPGSFTTVKTSGEQTDIDAVFEYLQELTLTQVPRNEWQVEGGGLSRLTVYTATEKYTVSLGAGYVVIDEKGYKASLALPKLQGGETTYTMESYLRECALSIGGEVVKTYAIDFEKIVFAKASETEFNATDIGYTLQVDGGEWLLYNEKYFFYADGDGENSGMYKIVGEVDLSQIFEEYPVVAKA